MIFAGRGIRGYKKYCHAGDIMIYCRYEQPCYKAAGLPTLEKREGGVNGDVYFSGFHAVWNVFDYTACLHRQEKPAKINKPTLYLSLIHI